jgi:hypothetical protein
MSRYVVRTLLVGAGIVAVSVAIIALRQQGGNNIAAWSAVSAALAVVAAVIAAWTSQRVVELQEDALAPNPVPWLDMRSRYQLAQFRITNRGGSPAYDVRIVWEQPLENANRERITLGVDSAIPIISPGDAASVNIGLSREHLKAWDDTTRRGTIAFADGAGNKYSRAFVVSAEHERVAMLYSDERVKTEYELQQIPAALKKIADELQKANARRDG